VLSGDDNLTLGVVAEGGQGVVSVVSNAAPRPMADLCRRALEGKMESARALHLQLHALMQAAFCESNPIPVKAALAMMGRMRNQLRLPLVPMDAKHESKLKASLVEAGALTK
jgi:4-hydroxy-tetrahydrodipicolinate synthase